MAAESTQALLATELVPSGQLVTFTLDNVEFGLDIDRVQEITHRTDVTPVPGARASSLASSTCAVCIIPVIDSRIRFHLAAPGNHHQDPHHRHETWPSGPTGLQVDSVAEVVRLEDHTVRETPPLVAGIRAEYLAGMVTVGTRLITLIHLEKLLDSPELTRRAELDELGMAGTFGGAGEEAEEEIEEDGRPFVTFRLGSESFGIALQEVEEIVELPP